MHLITAACIGMFLISQDCRGQEHLGCYADSTTDRLLPMLGEDSGSNTVDTCIDICKSRGKTYAGVALGTECWCGDFHNFSRHGVVTGPNNEGHWCNHQCSGNMSQICGGQGHINVYAVCPRGRYNDAGSDVGNCESECYCNASHICLFSTGQCPGDCQDGWYGTSCSLYEPLTTSSSRTTSMGPSTIDAVSTLETTSGKIMTPRNPTITGVVYMDTSAGGGSQVTGIAVGTTVAVVAVLIILGMVLAYICRHRWKRGNSSSHVQSHGRMETATEGVVDRVHQAIKVDTCVDAYDTKASSGANGEDTGDLTGAVYYNTKPVTNAGGSDGYANSQPKEHIVDTANSTGVYEEPHSYTNMSTEPIYTPLNQSAVYQNMQ